MKINLYGMIENRPFLMINSIKSMMNIWLYFRVHDQAKLHSITGGSCGLGKNTALKLALIHLEFSAVNTLPVPLRWYES